MFYVYAFYEVDSLNPFYIGKGQGRRMWEHYQLSELLCNDMFHCKLRSLILNDRPLIVKVLFKNLTEQEAFDYEIQLIALYGRRDLGTGSLCNQSNGGEGRSGFIQSEATRQKMSEVARSRIISDETRFKKNATLTGMKRSPVIKAKMGEISRAARGHPIESYNLQTGETVCKYGSISQAATLNHCSIEAIYGVIRKRQWRKSALGLGWRYTIDLPNPKPVDPDSWSLKPFSETSEND